MNKPHGQSALQSLLCLLIGFGAAGCQQQSHQPTERRVLYSLEDDPNVAPRTIQNRDIYFRDHPELSQEVVDAIRKRRVLAQMTICEVLLCLGESEEIDRSKTHYFLWTIPKSGGIEIGYPQSGLLLRFDANGRLVEVHQNGG